MKFSAIQDQIIGKWFVSCEYNSFKTQAKSKDIANAMRLCVKKLKPMVSCKTP